MSVYTADYYRRYKQAILECQRRYRAQAVTQVLLREARKAAYDSLTPPQRLIRNQAAKDWYAAHPEKAAEYVARRREKRRAVRKLLREHNSAALFPAPKGF
jgi:ribonuclease D